MIGPLVLSDDPRVAAAALDLAAGSLARDASVLWSHDGIADDTLALVGALGKLAALLAATMAADRQRAGDQITAAEILQAIRDLQVTRSA